jgi:diadenosine tetraphosphatase ApaH/serine/threonine PP2A family protein phosphatase
MPRPYVAQLTALGQRVKELAENSGLSAAQLAWLEQLPPTQVVGDIFLCHGTPASDMIYLLEHVTEHGVALRDSASIIAELNDVRQPVVVCGHSHVPRTVWLPDGRLVVNPGSVGIPAYDDDLPYQHVMEAGSPHARYAVPTGLTRWQPGTRFELVDYFLR